MARTRTGRWWGRAGAAALAALALAAGCDWFHSPAEVNLLPETVMEACPAPGAVVAGADALIAWSGSDPDGAVVKYVWSLNDTLTGETTATELVLPAVAEGDYLFEVAALDNDGDLDPTPAACSFAVGPAGGFVPRVVLAELLTTRPCANCPNAEAGLHTVLGEYGAGNLCVIAYHDLLPPADPLGTPETNARIDWYMGPSWNTWPAVIFDGDVARIVQGAGSPSTAAAAYRMEIDHRRTFGSPVSMRMAGSAASGSVTVTVKVREALTTTEAVLRVVVIEDHVVVASSVYDFVARDLLDDEPLSVASVGDSAVVTRSFAVSPSWNTANLSVIAFVQDDLTKEALQAARLGGR